MQYDQYMAKFGLFMTKSSCPICPNDSAAAKCLHQQWKVLLGLERLEVLVVFEVFDVVSGDSGHGIRRVKYENLPTFHALPIYEIGLG